MQSRAILLLGVFALVCLVVFGSLALHLTSAVARPPYPEDAPGSTPASRPRSINPFESRTETPEPAEPVSATEMATADTLEILLRRVQELFEYDDAGVSNAMIPHLAEMITIVNQNEELVYRLEITEPDGSLARRRAQTLNDVLRLNVLQPSNLRIIGKEGSHAAGVYVSRE